MMKAEQNFEVRVISLRNQKKRRENMRLILKDKLDWEFCDAIAGGDISYNTDFYDKKRRVKVFGYDMKINEIACFLSHRSVWEECAISKKCFLVLEDDIQLVPDVKEMELHAVISKLINTQGDSLFVRLGNSEIRSEKLKIINLDEIHALTRYRKDPLGAFAYLISPKTAAALLDKSQRIFTPVDDFMWRGWEHGRQLFDVFPYLIFTQEEGNPSSIGSRVKPKINLFKKISREWFRFLDVKNKKHYENSVFGSFKGK